MLVFKRKEDWRVLVSIEMSWLFFIGLEKEIFFKLDKNHYFSSLDAFLPPFRKWQYLAENIYLLLGKKLMFLEMRATLKT